MHKHSVHSRLILPHVRSEVIYEETPVSAGEELSAIVRFRHLGEKVKKSEEPLVRPENGDTKTEDGASNGNGWFGQRLSMQLTNTARSLFLDELEKEVEEVEDVRQKPVNLIMGFSQLSGVVTYDPHVISQTSIEEFRKKSAISGKIGGLDGLELSKLANEGLFNKITSGIGNLMNTTVDNSVPEMQEVKEDLHDVVPFFTTPKSLFFSEITLEPGEVQTFYIKIKLPKFIPPNYQGQAIKIKYNFIVGLQLNYEDPKPKILHFPLNISTFFNNEGYQPITKLDQFILLAPDNIESENVLQDGTRRRSSFKSIKQLAILQKKSLEVKAKQKHFLETLDKMIDNDDYAIDDIKTPRVKEVISIYTENILQHSDGDEMKNEIPKVIELENYSWEKQISKLQTQYILNQDGEFIASLNLSKPFYKVGESIKLKVDFQNSKIQTTGIFISLDAIELIRDTYSVDPSSSLIKNSYFEKSLSTFNNESISLNIPIPLHATSQFKTNIFELKWSLFFKFILAKEDLTESLHKDSNGDLISAKQNLAGSEFNVRLNTTILPSDKDYSGIVL